MIVKNEERCIQRCLDSAKPLVKKLVVVDTGSDDATVRICRDAGAEVHHFEWCDDFSVARNYALDVADSPWNLVLDADEWISPGFSFETEVLNEKFIGLFKRSDYFESSGHTETAVSWIPRLLPRGIRYQGIIHEEPASDLPRKKLNLQVQHDGYLNSSNISKNGRNKRLLLKSLEETPHDPYVLYQLGVDEEIYGDFSAAADLFEKAHSLINQEYTYKQVLVVRWLHCLSQAKRTDEAIRLVEKYRGVYKNYPDFFFAAGNVFLDHAMNDPGSAMNRWLPLAIRSWEECLAIGETPEAEGAVIGRGSFLAAKNLYAIYSNLGDQEKSQYYLKIASLRPSI